MCLSSSVSAPAVSQSSDVLPEFWLWVGMEVDLEQDSCQQQGVTGFGKQGGKSGVCARIHISFCVAGDEAERTAVLTAKKKTSQSFVFKQQAIKDHC